MGVILAENVGCVPSPDVLLPRHIRPQCSFLEAPINLTCSTQSVKDRCRYLDPDQTTSTHRSGCDKERSCNGSTCERRRDRL